MSLLKDNDNLMKDAASMENLEKQILEAAADSPPRDNRQDKNGDKIMNIGDSSKF